MGRTHYLKLQGGGGGGGGGPPGGDDNIFAGDPVSCSSGLFLHRRSDVTLPDILPLEISSTYRPGDTVNQPFGLGTAHAYAQRLYFPSTSTYATVQLVLPDSRVLNYSRVTPGTGTSGAIFESQSEPSGYFKSRISFAAGNRWVLQTKDGRT